MIEKKALFVFVVFIDQDTVFSIWNYSQDQNKKESKALKKIGIFENFMKNILMEDVQELCEGGWVKILSTGAEVGAKKIFFVVPCPPFFSEPLVTKNSWNF